MGIAADQELVTICASCRQASCWQGAFMCEEAASAGTTTATVDELRQQGLENPEYWDVCPEHGVARAKCKCSKEEEPWE